MSSFREILDRLRSQARTERDKGSYFEKLMIAVLQQHPEYDFRGVWSWKDWPEREKLSGMDAKDIGIDLVGKNADGKLCAIQCKFFAEDYALQKKDIDSFFTESGKKPFTSRLIITTTDKWSDNAKKALQGQQIETHRMRFMDLQKLPIDWDLLHPERTKYKPKKHKLKKRQQEALEHVIEGFKKDKRGRLIMACGTGKTLTSLHIAEKLVSNKGNILLMVPSIGLMSQTLHEWAEQRSEDQRYLAVCSDAQVDKREEDITLEDLAIPATTKAEKIHKVLSAKENRRTVVLCTYHSLDRIKQAQDKGAPKFDLVICDEAHRTTGIEGSLFSKINHEDYIKADKRLYMTATPRIYTEEAKAKAKEKDIGVFSMDDKSAYGPQFYRLDFSDAVAENLLSDYKVIILNVNKEYVHKEMQALISKGDNEFPLDDIAKIIGCYKGLRDQGEGKKGTFLKRAVMFAQNIKISKHLSKQFKHVVDVLDEKENDNFTCNTEHVDGSYGSLERSRLLDWLEQDAGSNEHGEICNILSNVRCLTEGIDVPSLDAVLFMHPRQSQVDVVQAVGRVMRRAEGKDYGYIILPVAISAGASIDETLNSNEYKKVWAVLNALRSHDNRFNAMINKVDLNDKKPKAISVIGVGFGSDDDDDEKIKKEIEQQIGFNFGELQNAVYAKTVEKCGNRKYWESWAKDVAGIYKEIESLIETLRKKNEQFLKTYNDFLDSIKRNINTSLTNEDATSMLAQHLITKPVFDALFKEYKFSEKNPVSQSMGKVLDELYSFGLKAELEKLQSFYKSVEDRASNIDNAEGRQKVIIELYEKFFKTAFPKVAERQGIAYTPIEIVDFILASADKALQQEFGQSLSDKNVHIIDPFTGTGTFINRLIQNKDLIQKKDIKHKFENEIHANEILLLAYYIASVNIEESYHGRQQENKDYETFKGIVLTDTFNLHEKAGEDKGSLEEKMFLENNARLIRQRAAPIKVIVGNPPWSVGQKSENDDAQNISYPKLDESIENSYAKKSKATLKSALYDSYIRSFRWASDRIGEKGVIAFVSNGGWLDGSSTDGFRQSLAEEFDAIWVFNARGNARLSGEAWRKEGDKIFGQSSRAPVAFTILVKNPQKKRAIADIHYHDIGDYLSRKEKLEKIVKAKDITGLEWQKITPNKENDWINQRDPLFQKFKALGSKDVKAGKRAAPDTIFRTYSRGIMTCRDAWVYNFSKKKLSENMQTMIGFYNEQVKAFQKTPNGFVVDNNPSKISWDGTLKDDLKNNSAGHFDRKNIRQSLYRPFTHEWLYFNRQFSNRVYRMPSLFPEADTDNRAIVITGMGAAKDFSALISGYVSEVQLLSNAQCFPRYFWQEGEREDNIPNTTLKEFRTKYKDDSITGDDIFDYVYGILHAPDYQKRFANDLKKELARIPLAKDFTSFRNAGRALAKLHLNFEQAEEYPLNILVNNKPALPDILKQDYTVTKMKWHKEDKTKLIYNNQISLSNIPEQALRYQVSGRPALQWIIDRYQLKLDKASQITNDPNDWIKEQNDPQWLIKHIKRITYISVESTKIIEALPKAL